MRGIVCFLLFFVLFPLSALSQVEEGDYIVFKCTKSVLPHFSTKKQKKTWERMPCSRRSVTCYWIANVDSVKKSSSFAVYPLPLFPVGVYCLSDDQLEALNVSADSIVLKVAEHGDIIAALANQHGETAQTIKSEWGNGDREVVSVTATPVHGRFILCDDLDMQYVKALIPSYISVSDAVHKPSVWEDENVRKCLKYRYNCLLSSEELSDYRNKIQLMESKSIWEMISKQLKNR